MFCEACAMCTGETVDQSNCVQLPRDIMCLPIGSMLLRSKILWMKHVVSWREPDGVIPRATGDRLTGRWDSRKVLRHCHNTWKTSTYARRCWSSRFWHSDWKSGLFPDFYRKYSKVRTFPGPGGQQLKIRTFPGNKDPWEPCVILHEFSRAASSLCPANERWRYIVTWSHIGWGQAWNQPWISIPAAYVWTPIVAKKKNSSMTDKMQS